MWGLLGYVPKYPKSNAEKDKDNDSTIYLTYYHECIRNLLSELKGLIDNKSGNKVFVPGHGFFYFHFKLAFIIGDNKGHDDVCCHYQAYSSSIKK